MCSSDLHSCSVPVPVGFVAEFSAGVTLGKMGVGWAAETARLGLGWLTDVLPAAADGPPSPKPAFPEAPRPNPPEVGPLRENPVETVDEKGAAAKDITEAPGAFAGVAVTAGIFAKKPAVGAEDWDPKVGPRSFFTADVAATAAERSFCSSVVERLYSGPGSGEVLAGEISS